MIEKLYSGTFSRVIADVEKVLPSSRKVIITVSHKKYITTAL